MTRPLVHFCGRVAAPIDGMVPPAYKEGVTLPQNLTRDRPTARAQENQDTDIQQRQRGSNQ